MAMVQDIWRHRLIDWGQDMSRTLYLECNSGISGDMFVGALLDLGADREVLKKALKSLSIDGFLVKISEVKKAEILACDFDVLLAEKYEIHDHDMQYLHGTKEPVSESVKAHHHMHRTLEDIIGILDRASLSERARCLAKRIFYILAEAEAKVHGCEAAKVRFHEVGAIDSIVDITAAAVCMDNLNIDNTIIPFLAEGTGTIRCQHGMLPIPVPAVTQIVSVHEIPMQFIGIEGEFVTPSGAAIAAAIKTSTQLPKQFVIKQIGVGAGKRTYERPSLLRAMLIEESVNEKEDVIYKLESNIDDCTGENFGYVMERLLEAGARDVHYMPVFMKKNRPAYQLNVICKKEDIESLERIIFEETTTIGIRRQKMERSILQREIKSVSTIFGNADVKVCRLKKSIRFYPEYESVTELCQKNQKTYSEVYQAVIEACRDE